MYVSTGRNPFWLIAFVVFLVTVLHPVSVYSQSPAEGDTASLARPKPRVEATTSGQIPKFQGNGGTVTDSVMSESSGNITVAGNVLLGSTTNYLGIKRSDGTQQKAVFNGAVLSDSDYLDFGALPNGFKFLNAANTPLLTIQNGGNVGIGTTSPSELLHLNSTGAGRIRIDSTTARVILNNITATTGRRWDVTSDIDGKLNIADQTAGLNRVAVDTNGNVGIGTTTPGARLDIAAGAIARGSDTDLIIGTTVPQIEFYGSSASAAVNYMNNAFTVWTNGPSWRNALNVGNNGRVGIGITDPQYDLHLYGSDNAPKSLVVQAVSNGTNSYADGELLADKQAFSMRAYSSGFTTFTHAGIALANMAEIWADQTVPESNAGLLIGTGVRTTMPHPPIILATDGAERMRIEGDGNVIIGPAGSTGSSALNVVGAVHATGAITSDVGIYSIFQDVAEWVPVAESLAPGTVVVLNPARGREVMPSSSTYDTTVAGVVSEHPGITLGRAGADKAQIATTGRVKVKVDATGNPIRVGDLLVTSGVAGTAMRSVPVQVAGISMHRPGTIIGKALEPLESGTGEILVLLSLQ